MGIARIASPSSQERRIKNAEMKWKYTPASCLSHPGAMQDRDLSNNQPSVDRRNEEMRLKTSPGSTLTSLS